MPDFSPTMKDVVYALGHAGEELVYTKSPKPHWRLSGSGLKVSDGVVNTIRTAGLVELAPNGNMVWRGD